MANIFDKIGFMSGATEQEIYARAEEEIRKFIRDAENGGITGEAMRMFVALAIRIGVMDDGQLSDVERNMLQNVIDSIDPTWTDEIMKNCQGSVNESLLKFKMMHLIGASDLVMIAANIALSFAYIDGVFEDETAEQLYAVVSFGGNLFTGDPEDLFK